MATSVWRNAVDTAIKDSTHTPLPTGSCNFRPLSSGSPTCGCRRFWLDRPVSVPDGSNSEERAFCFCGHHACFHDIQTSDVTPSARRSHHSATPTIARNDTFAALNDHRDVGYLTCPQLRQTIHVSNPARDHDFVQPGGGGKATGAPNNIWVGLNALARWQQDPSWIPSTAPPSVLSYDQREGLLNESQRKPKERPTSPERPYIPPFPNMQDVIFSPTVEGSIRESVGDPLQMDPISELHPTQREPHLADVQLPSTDHEIPASNIDITEQSPKIPSSPHNETGETQATPSKIAALTQDWQNLIQTCMQRLGDLENVSFSHVPVEEVQDKFEMLDGRLLDLEYWKADLEARLKASEMLVDDKDSSVSSILSKTNNETFLSRVADIEQRLEELEGVQPSYACPWEIEVVLLPFGRRLNGIWHESTDDAESKEREPGLDEWSGRKTPASNLLASAQNERTAWTADSIRAWADTIHPWLWPKAPGPNNKAFRRLRSRGLVRTISLTETGAYGIWSAVKEAFSDFLDGQTEHTPNPQQKSYQALNQPLVPLRKIRKTSWLRFLSPHELITPSTWDLAFLNSGVFMHAKGGIKRLYLTTSDAYTQSYNDGWTWQRIRELPPTRRQSVKPGVVTSKEDYYEPCWDYTAALDDTPSFGSFTSTYSAPESSRGRSPTRNEPSSPRSQSSASSTSTILLRQTFSSFPVITRKIPSQPKRRTSPSCAPIAYQKRRRMSSSPGFCGGPIDLTPRWSHEPPTPSLTDNLWDARSTVLASGSRKRGSTPFAYATPHSHGFKNLYFAMADAGDTEVEDEDEGDGEASEKEWEGVEEGNDGDASGNADVDVEEEQGMYTAQSSFGAERKGSSRDGRRSFGSAGSSGVEFGAEDDNSDGDGWTIYEA